MHTHILYFINKQPVISLHVVYFYIALHKEAECTLVFALHDTLIYEVSYGNLGGHSTYSANCHFYGATKNIQLYKKLGFTISFSYTDHLVIVNSFINLLTEVRTENSSHYPRGIMSEGSDNFTGYLQSKYQNVHFVFKKCYLNDKLGYHNI